MNIDTNQKFVSESKDYLTASSDEVATRVFEEMIRYFAAKATSSATAKK